MSLKKFSQSNLFFWAAPRLQYLVHSHCHQKSLFGTKGDVAILAALGRVESLTIK